MTKPIIRLTVANSRHGFCGGWDTVTYTLALLVDRRSSILAPAFSKHRYSYPPVPQLNADLDAVIRAEPILGLWQSHKSAYRWRRRGPWMTAMGLKQPLWLN